MYNDRYLNNSDYLIARKEGKRTTIMKITKILPLITTLALMVLIFLFSAQSSQESTVISKGIAEPITDAVVAAKHLPQSEKPRLMKITHHLVRKTAHFTLYAALGASALALFLSMKSDKKKRILLLCSVIFCAVYAISDELHQHFVSGRTPMISDVLLDTLGALCGGSVFLLIFTLCLRIKKHKK